MNKQLALLGFSTAPLFLIISNFLPQERNASFSTLVFIVIIVILNFVLKRWFYDERQFIISSNLIQTILILFYFLILTLITQNYLLHFEIIDWDISSYIVASNEIANGYLPNETQWESKGPILIYMYYFVLGIVSGNFIYFKIANDLLLFLIACIFFFTSLVISKNKLFISVIATSIFILLMSQPWAVSGYSELYALLFISTGIFIYKKEDFTYKYFLVGLMFALSTLVNQGTIIFLIPLLIGIIWVDNPRNKLFKIFIGFTVPHILFLFVYQLNGLLDVYLTTFLTIPISYTAANYSNLYELKVFMRSFFEFNFGLYFVLLIIFFIIFKNFTKNKNFIKSSFYDTELLLLGSSFLFYFIASHNYYHHLIFFLYFISMYVAKLKFDINFVLIISFVLLTIFISLSASGFNSYSNLRNLDKLYENYPLKQLAEEIENRKIDELEVLALDYNLLLHYLGVPNYSYIVHGTNFLEPYILTSLEEIGLIEKDYLNSLKNKKPKVIICSEYMIVRGEVQNQAIFPCNQDHLLDYNQVNTDVFFTENLNYYRDPYKEIKLFIRR